ncbi:MAG: dTDP-4-dehydrorhamnose 3,5-epimerase [Sedimentisphaerales bacterium]|nr:dTDP-4-dehydrorhamnose 3,5-epimerase [Sedimentisphaerales bacterium]
MTEAEVQGVLIFEPDVFGDHRGWFEETYSRKRYAESGLDFEFVQDNVSFSQKGTLRGLHFQNPNAQAKLVQVLAGEVFDAAVDVRIGSPTFGKWTGLILSGDNHKQMYIPKGFAHGYCVLSEAAIFSYKCDEYYSPEDELGIIYNDPDIGIEWPVSEAILSQKDSAYSRLKDIPQDKLPRYEV